MIPHIISFPTMYNTWGQRLGEPTLKNWRIQKNTTFWADLLAIFPNHLTSQRSGEFFYMENLFFYSFMVMVWYGASKWANRKLGEGIIVRVMSNIVKQVTYHGNLSKIHSPASNAKYFNLFGILYFSIWAQRGTGYGDMSYSGLCLLSVLGYGTWLLLPCYPPTLSTN